jgi:outer membrane receptor protein involved in Fe transport
VKRRAGGVVMPFKNPRRLIAPDHPSIALSRRRSPGPAPNFTRRLLLALLVLLALWPSRALAQDDQPLADVLNMSIEDLMKVNVESVWGAAGYQQKVTEAPAAVTIVTGDEIRRYGYRSLADVLQNVPGFYVSYDRNYSYLGVRGFGRPGDYNSRILLLVDGHRANDNVYDQAMIGTEFPVDIDLIDRVEVIRGPNSSLYVASAFLGVVNVITKRGRDAKNVTATAELASYGTLKTRVSYGNRFPNGLEMLLSGSYYNSQGHDRLYFKEFDTPQTNHGIAQDVDGDQFHQFFANLAWGHFKVQGVYGSREKQIPTASFGTLFDIPGTRTVDARGYLDVDYDHHFGGDWGYTGRIHYDSYNYNGAYLYDTSSSGGPSQVTNWDFSFGKWWGAEFALSKKLFAHQTLVVGSEYRDNLEQTQINYDAQPYLVYLNDHRNSAISGVYAQDEIQIRGNLILDLGLRYDYYSTFGGTTNPRAALIYTPLEKTTIKLLYGQAFRAPNDYELYYQGYGYEANPRLRPETVKTMELDLEQYFDRGLRVVVSGYFYPIRGLISQETDPANGWIVYRNSGRVNIQGWEVALKKRSPSGLEAGVSFSLQDAKNLDGGMPLTNSPHEVGQANLSVPLFNRRLFASTNLNYVSRRKTLAGNYAGAYVVPNFTLFSPSLLRGWEVSASLYNAFNEIYGDPGAAEHRQDVILQDGRSFRLALTRHF